MSKRKPKPGELINEAMLKIEHARKYRNHHQIDGRWRRMVNLYQGKHFNSGEVSADVDVDKIAINVSKTVIDTILPSIAINYPKFDVNARHPEHESNAVIATQLLDYDWRRYDFKRPCNLALLDSLIMGIGWVKVGWLYIEDGADKTSEEMHDEYSSALEEMDEYELANPDEPETPDEVVAAGITNKTVRAIQDRPTVVRVDPHDIFLDPEAMSVHDCHWLVHRTYMTKDEVMDNAAFNPKVARKVQPSHYDSPLDSASQYRNQPGDERLICVWEYWDLRNSMSFTFAEGSDDFLIAPRKSPYGFSPFEPMLDFEVPNVLYPMGELDAVEPIQQELNKTRSQLMNARKKHARKYLYDPMMLSDTSAQILERNEDLAFVPIEEGTGDLHNAIVPLPHPPISADLYQGVEQSLSDIQLVSGRNEYQMNAEQAHRRTATEAAIVDAVTRSRADYKLQRYQDFLSRVGRKILMLNQKFLTEETAVRITGPQGLPLWFYFEPEWIEGEFDFEVVAGSTAPDNSQLKSRKAMELAQALAPFIANGVVNPVPVAEAILKAHGHMDAAKFLLAPPMMPPGAPGAPPPPGQPQEAPGVTPMQVAQEGLDPALVNQLQGQVGLQVASPDGP